ncbi:MAG: energy transducer TonB [Candidatus Fermentibacteraceae bacterium]|nr:energy transducer TonB [Candidatus Fermentibacteraceae bacterium]
MINILLTLFISLVSITPLDQAIELYLMGDMNGSITALEILLEEEDLSLDEEIRAYHRLGAAYYGIGEPQRTESAFLNILLLDPYYDLGPWENPAIRQLLDHVRQESLATVLIQGEPEGALVFMNGNYVGTAPYIQDNLIGGQTYTFAILAEGYNSDVILCETLPGQLHTIGYNMSLITSETEVAFLDTTTIESQPDLIPEVNEEASGGSSTLPEESGQSVAEEAVAEEAVTEEAVIEEAVNANPDANIGSLNTDQLNELLQGGIQMTSLGNIGPLTTGVASQMESIGNLELERDPTLFENTNQTIVTTSEIQARMVFSDINLGNETILQTAPGSTYSSRTSTEIMEVLSSKSSSLAFIYNKHLRADPILSGTVLIEMIVEPSGRVSDVSILESTTFNPAFDLELAAAVGTWRFGAVDADEGPLPVTYPFNFSR